MRICSVDRVADSVFRYNAALVCRYPVSVIVVLVVFTVVCSMKTGLVEIEDDFESGYTPQNARALTELEAYRDFGSGVPLMVLVFVKAADGGSMARLEHLNATVNVLNEIGTHIKVNNQSFYDVCSAFCNANEPVIQFRNGMEVLMQKRNNLNNTIFDDLTLHYPVMTLMGHSIDLTPNFHGVEVINEEQAANQTTNIKHLAIITLIIRFNKPDSWTSKDALNWDSSMRRRFNEEQNDSLVQSGVLSAPFMQSEVTRTSTLAFPYISLGFASVVIFSVVTVVFSSWYMDQLSAYKLLYATVACICPLMASGACLGLMFWCGMRFASILLISPFLLLAIGVDDAYIVMSAWERICARRRRDPVSNDTLENRIAELLIEAGPSITVTSLTNVLAFAISAISATPDIRLFCIANVIAMMLNLIYILTLFMAFLVLGARNEMRSKRPVANHSIGKVVTLFNLYCKWLSSISAAVCISLVMCAYWATSIYGIRQIQPSVHPFKQLPSDSPIEPILKWREEYVRPEYSFVTVIVGKAGNLTDVKRRQRIFSMVDRFEAMPECNGARFTHLWMRDYDTFLAVDATEVEIDYSNDGEGDTPYSTPSIRDFLEWPQHEFLADFMQFDNATDRIVKFIITIPYHGKDIAKFREKLRLMKQWRSIVDDYEDLSASVFDDDAQFIDQIEDMVPRMVQNTIYSFLCMVLVCALFMPNITNVFTASASIFSIFIGVTGFSTLWGVELDTMSLAALILTIGMAVDYPAHITYYYYHETLKLPSAAPGDVMAKALSTIAFPLLQCCISNLLIISCLCLANTQSVSVIVKTVTLVVVLGTVHALVVIPSFLCTLSRVKLPRFSRSGTVTPTDEPKNRIYPLQSNLH